MSALTKTKRPVRKPTRAAPSRPAIPGLSPRRTPPPAKSTAADLLRLRDFGRDGNWDIIEAAHAARDL